MGCDQSRARDVSTSRERPAAAPATRTQPQQAAQRPQTELAPATSYTEQRLHDDSYLEKLLENTTSKLIATVDVPSVGSPREFTERSKIYSGLLQKGVVRVGVRTLPTASAAVSAPIAVLEAPLTYTPADVAVLSNLSRRLSSGVAGMTVKASVPLVQHLPADDLRD
eukprot:m.747348 g.747348  ORF g.747348 m.747348 type:complete len:167 (-) comp58962_c1_seq1:23-523(-)